MRLTVAHLTSAAAGRHRIAAARGQARPLIAAVAVLALVLSVAAAVGVLPRTPVGSARADEVTASQNNLRTGWDTDEPGLAPVGDGGPVGGSGFGQLFETHLNGQIYAQPVIAGKTVIVGTETNHVYGLNAVTGAVEWSDYLGPAQSWKAAGCPDLVPDIGITSTPVYDPSTGTVYLVAVVNNGPTQFQPHVYAYALDAQTGKSRTGWPVSIHGSPVNDHAIAFNPLSERQRTGLLLLNGHIYMGFGSYCDYEPYAGYLAGISTSSRAVSLWSDEAGLTDNQGGIWQGASGLMSDGAGRIFVATGNGVSPPAGPGTSPPPELGDSVVRLNVAADGTLSAADFFSPSNAPTLDADDEDFGSGGSVGLPFGTASFPGLLVQAGKDGRVFLLNRNNLGGRDQGPDGSDAMVSVSGPYGGQWGHPAAFGPEPTVTAPTSGDYVYYVGAGDVMRYLQFGVNASGTPVLSDVANTSTTYGYSSGSPVVTSNGNDPSSAVIWEVDSTGGQGANSSLQAFGAAPASTCTSSAPCTMAPIWSAPIGTASKFTIPATDSGRVYVGTRDGNVLGFGSPDMAPLSGPPANFGTVAVGGKARTQIVTMTAAATVHVTGISIAAPAGQAFRLGGVTVNGSRARFPVTLSSGDKLSASVTFTPVHSGGVTTAVQAATTDVNFPRISVSLTGQGTAPGLQARPATLSFGKRPDGTSITKTVLLTNESTGAESVTSASRPGAPFSAKLPAKGREIKPGQSVAVQVSFRPHANGARASTFAITTSGGHTLKVGLTGSGKTAVSRLTASHAVISFGKVHLGQRASRNVVLTNKGNLAVVINRASGLSAPYGLQVPNPAGLPLTPGYTASVPVTFTPTSPGQVTSRYVLHWSDAAGSHVLSLTLTGTGIGAATGKTVPPPGGGWTLNGSAALHGSGLELTGAARNAAGSAVYAVPEPTKSLNVQFTATLGGDGGMTFGLLPAKTASVRALGGTGAKLGFGGLPGLAVTLATGQASGHRSGAYVGVAVGTATGLRYIAAKSLPGLSAGANRVDVALTGDRIRVHVQGKLAASVLLAARSIPSSALLAFTGSSGSAAGSQTAGGFSVRVGGSTLPAPGGGWSFNGSAAMSGSSARLTTAAKNEAGAVVYPAAVPTSGLKVSFTAQIYGGSGSDGLTLALLNPPSPTTSLGGDGAALGFAGLSGVAIALNTAATIPDHRAQDAAIITSSPGSTDPVYVEEADAIPPLRGGPVSMTVQVSSHDGGYIVTVWLDGAQILQQTAPGLGATSVLAFTGSTGGKTDLHLVRDVAISAAS